MSNNPLIQYWDSDVLIHAIQRTPEHIAEIEPLINEAESGNLQILLSTFSLMEVYKDLDGENAMSKDDDELIVSFFENPFFIFKDLTYPIALSARQISREFGVKPKDAVHVATALYYKIPIFFSYDERLLNKTGKIGNPALEIVKPFWKGQPELIGMTVEPVENAEKVKLIAENTTAIENSDGTGDSQEIELEEILPAEKIGEKANAPEPARQFNFND